MTRRGIWSTPIEKPVRRGEPVQAAQRRWEQAFGATGRGEDPHAGEGSADGNVSLRRMALLIIYT